MKSLYALALIATIWMHPSHADELQDRLESAVKAFGELIPQAADVGLGWAQDRIDGAVAQSNPSQIIQTSSIGDWVVANQPTTLDPQTKQRAEWLGATFKTVMGVNTVYSTALPSQSIRVAELQIRIKTAMDKVMPGPTKAEREAEIARIGKSIEEAAKDKAARIEARRLEQQWGMPTR